jgi:L-asparaginase
MAGSSVLLIYTGGTIGMIEDPISGLLKPFDFSNVSKQIPELNRLSIHVDYHLFDKAIDSSDMQPSNWRSIADLIHEKYQQYDGFVVLHGTDTMAYTASVLSFMLQGLQKPVIFTGSQLPIGIIRTDGKENLITAIEIAGAKNEIGEAIVKEIGIYFEYKLLRANRTFKYSANHFDAFKSPNYPPLAEAGVIIEYAQNYLFQSKSEFKYLSDLNLNIGSLKFFPAITEKQVRHQLLDNDLDAIILETYGNGNAPTAKWLEKILQDCVHAKKQLVDITQCIQGNVMLGKYQASQLFMNNGVVSGHDMTFEAAIAKTTHLLGNVIHYPSFNESMGLSLVGELSIMK